VRPFRRDVLFFFVRPARAIHRATGTPDPFDHAYSLRLRRPIPIGSRPSPTLHVSVKSEFRPCAPMAPRQLANVQSAVPSTIWSSGKGNRPIAGAGHHRFAWPIARPERRSSVTIYKAVPSRCLLPSHPSGRDICQLVVDSPRIIHRGLCPVKADHRRFSWPFRLRFPCDSASRCRPRARSL
jgi:hypothetical protein